MRIGLAALCAAAAAVALAACGGDDDDGERTRSAAEQDDSALIARADEICEEAEDAGEDASQVVGEYIDPETTTELDDVVESLDDFLDDAEDVVEELGELDPPAGEARESWEEMLELAEEQVEVVSDARDLARQRATASTSFEEDSAALQELLGDPEIEERSDDLDELAEELGLEECFRERDR